MTSHLSANDENTTAASKLPQRKDVQTLSPMTRTTRLLIGQPPLEASAGKTGTFVCKAQQCNANRTAADATDAPAPMPSAKLPARNPRPGDQAMQDLFTK